MIRLMRQVVRATAWLVLLLGAPAVLTTVITVAAPPGSWRSHDTPPLTTAVIDIADAVGWILWAILAGLVARNLASAVRRHTRHPRLPMSLHGTLTAITGMAAVGAASLWHPPHTTAGPPSTPTATTPMTNAADPTPAGPVPPTHATKPPHPQVATVGQRTADQPAPTTAATPTAPGTTPTAVPAGQWPRTILASATTPTPATQVPAYQVEHGDWLGDIAERFLGDFNRYPDIAHLNPALVHNPDHVEPGWRLVLPSDAHDRGPRAHATAPPATPPPAATSPNPGPATPGRTTPGNGSTAGASTPSPATGPSPSTNSSTPAPATTGGQPAPADPAAVPGPTGPSATRSGQSTTADSTDPPPATVLPAPPGHGVGVTVPGGWIGIPFAAALAAAATTVWLRRRHRYLPTPLDLHAINEPDLRPLPAVVDRIRRSVREHAPDLLQPSTTATPTVADYRDTDAVDRPDLPPAGPSGPDLAGLADRIPAGGLGLVGPGAEPAARALLVATLSSGSPPDPDAKGHVIIPANGLTTLFGADAVRVGDMPRMKVTANLSEALTHAEELLIERRRLLEDHDAATLAEICAANPYHPPMPPVLLLAETPPAALRARATTVLHLGGPLQISAVLLGDWPPGDTLTVRTDGHTSDPCGARLGVLDVPTALHLLDMLREAHTSQPPTAPADTPPSADMATPPPPVDPPDDAPAEPVRDEAPPAHADTTADPTAASTTPTTAPTPGVMDQDEPATPADTAPTPMPAAGRARHSPMRVQLLGQPIIFDRDGNPVNGLRHHARELLVYLAVHRSGADLSQIMEAFWPTATVRRAGERLSTEAGNLRGRIKHAAGVTKDDKDFQPVVNTGGRYHLNPDLVHIDVWRLIDLLRRAGATTDATTRAALLRQAVDSDTGTLAEGHDYDWISQPREQLRRHSIRARLDLATLLGDTEPATAADLLRAAARLDPINEELARQAIRALARVGDATGVRAILHQLRAALDDIDEEPSAETIALAAQLPRDNANKAADDPTAPPLATTDTDHRPEVSADRRRPEGGTREADEGSHGRS